MPPDARARSAWHDACRSGPSRHSPAMSTRSSPPITCPASRTSARASAGAPRTAARSGAGARRRRVRAHPLHGHRAGHEGFRLLRARRRSATAPSPCCRTKGSPPRRRSRTGWPRRSSIALSMDIIFASGNGLGRVDDDWFRYAPDASLYGEPIRVVPVGRTALLEGVHHGARALRRRRRRPSAASSGTDARLGAPHPSLLDASAGAVQPRDPVPLHLFGRRRLPAIRPPRGPAAARAPDAGGIPRRSPSAAARCCRASNTSSTSCCAATRILVSPAV